MPLIIHSNSTKQFAEVMDGVLMKFDGILTGSAFNVKANRRIIAIGGGGVIDFAKIISKNSGDKKIVAISTTASGAAETSHAVYWQNFRKYSVKTQKPISEINPDFLKTLPKKIARTTSYDALSHALESYWSKDATDISKGFALASFEMVADQIENDYLDLEQLVEGGNLAGKAIEITGTNIAHAISYPLTGIYGVPHGLAVGFVLPAVARHVGCEIRIPNYKMELEKKFDVNLVASEAMSYSQIHNATKNINKKQVMDILNESLEDAGT